MDDNELFGNSEQLDTISRAAVLDEIHKYMEERDYTIGTLYDNICEMPPAQPVPTYQTCSNALLKMWMDNVLTDGEYNRIMDKLNAHWGKGEEHGASRTVPPEESLR